MRGNFSRARTPANSEYTLRVMPYNEDLRENFIDLTKPDNIPIFLLVAIVVILFLLYRR
ncbi:hypothetical protein [carnivorous sponge associated iridovirus]|jgi:hypothetical protein|nr:hypothetical protein [carnivorous sponge associated iridovirus]